MPEVAEMTGITKQAVSERVNSVIDNLSTDEEIQGLRYYLHREI